MRVEFEARHAHAATHIHEHFAFGGNDHRTAADGAVFAERNGRADEPRVCVVAQKFARRFQKFVRIGALMRTAYYHVRLFERNTGVILEAVKVVARHKRVLHAVECKRVRLAVRIRIRIVAKRNAVFVLFELARSGLGFVVPTLDFAVRTYYERGVSEPRFRFVRKIREHRRFAAFRRGDHGVSERLGELAADFFVVVTHRSGYVAGFGHYDNVRAFVDAVQKPDHLFKASVDVACVHRIPRLNYVKFHRLSSRFIICFRYLSSGSTTSRTRLAIK